MSISATRYKFLDRETNIPTLNFLTTRTSDIFNLPGSSMGQFLSGLQGLVNAAARFNPQTLLRETVSQIPGLRQARDFVSSTMDTVGLTGPVVDQLAHQLFSNNRNILNTLKQMAPSVLGSMLSHTQLSSLNQIPTVINGVTRFVEHTTAELAAGANLINSIVPGTFAPNIVNTSAIGRTIQGVGSLGYRLGLPGVFSALTANSTLSTIAGSGSRLLNAVASTGNTHGMMDIMGDPNAGLLTSVCPGLTRTVMSAMAIPREIKGLATSFYNNVTTSIRNLDVNWNRAEDGILSCSNFGDDSKILPLFNNYAASKAVLPGSTPVSGIDESGYLYMGGQMGIGSARDQLDRSFALPVLY